MRYQKVKVEIFDTSPYFSFELLVWSTPITYISESPFVDAATQTINFFSYLDFVWYLTLFGETA